MRGENVEIKEQIPQNENVHCDHIGIWAELQICFSIPTRR